LKTSSPVAQENDHPTVANKSILSFFAVKHSLFQPVSHFLGPSEARGISNNDEYVAVAFNDVLSFYRLSSSKCVLLLDEWKDCNGVWIEGMDIHRNLPLVCSSSSNACLHIYEQHVIIN